MLKSYILGLSKIISALIVLAAISLSTAQAQQDSAGQQQAAHELIKRVTPSLVDRFELEIIPAADGLDVYELDSKDGKIVLRGNNGISIASAYNRYLGDYCNVLYSLWGDQMALPATLPIPTEKVRVVNPRKIRHFFNYCTFNYTATWWNWDRWQKMIDILAMHGVNMPLAIVGVEGVWYHSLLEVGFTDQEAREFIAAPTYLNWQWMSNLEGTGGPIPKSYIDSHIVLGKQIMDRQMSLGMTPIVHGFSGHVPRLFKEKFPDARVDLKHGWARGSFDPAAQLDPMDPLFNKFGAIYLNNQIKLLGTAGYYMSDPFHEGSPPVQGDEYLAKVGKSISALFTSVDPNATWVMQTWSLREPIAKAVAKDKLLIMNLHGNRWEKLADWGYPFTQGQLNNFGGRTFMHGDLEVVAQDLYSTVRKRSEYCVGVGNWTEGINDNPVNYHLALEMNWAEGAIDLKQWLNKYTQRRYGLKSAAAEKAWQYLLEGPYSMGGFGYSSMLAGRPGLRPISAGPNKSYARSYTYDSKLLARAWQQLLEVDPAAMQSAGFQFDLVDVSRQSLSNLVAYQQVELTKAFEAGDREKLNQVGQEMVELIGDIDKLVSSCPQMLMGVWQKDAMDWATNDEERAYYNTTAATLPTIWGTDNPDNSLYDYAWREWGGLISTFYQERWKLWIKELDAKLAAGERYADPPNNSYGRASFRGDDIHSKMADFEMAYCANPPKLSSEAIGDSREIAQSLFNKYSSQLMALPDHAPEYPALVHPDLGIEVATWAKKSYTNKFKPVTIDVTENITGQGDYIFSVVTSFGPSPALKNLKLYENGLLVSEGTALAADKNDDKQTTYKFSINQHAMGASYEIKFDAKASASGPTEGRYHFRID